MNKKRREIIANNQISRIMSCTLGGYEQKVLFDGKFTDNPLMLCLHGGPGLPVPFSLGCRGMFPEFTEHFIMVYWDQLGCGGNNYPIDDSFSIDDFAAMTVDLVKILKKEFPENKVLLLGTSWGSVLAAKAAVRRPDLIDTVLVYGQVLSNLSFNEEVFESLLCANLSPKLKARVMALREKEKPETKDSQFIAKLIRQKTEGYQNKSGGKMPLWSIFSALLSSPDYSFNDFTAIVKNGYLKNRSIWQELTQIDLRDTLSKVSVPYRILQGDTDIVTSTKMISAFVAECENKNLTLRVLEGNGHMPGPVGMEEIFRESLELVGRFR